MFEKLFAFFLGGKAAETTQNDVREEEVQPVVVKDKSEQPEKKTPAAAKPEFIFPETEEVFLKTREKLEGAIVVLRAEEERLCEQSNQSHKKTATSAKEEIELRRERNHISDQLLVIRKSISMLSEEKRTMVERLQKKEKGRYLDEGTVITETEWSNGGPHDLFDEKRVVVYWEGEVILLCVRRNAKFRDTGKYVPGPYSGSHPERVRTGEFHPEHVEWATRSLSQFRMGELEAAYRFEEARS